VPIAAVLVPQAINPSSANLQFVPLDAITETDLTMEQAMSMLLTGGAVCPEVIHYCAPASRDTAALAITTETSEAVTARTTET
jgi:uncharacterized membrane protein